MSTSRQVTYASALLLMLLGATGSLTWWLVKRGQPLPELTSSDSTLLDAQKSGLKAVKQLRKTDRRTVVNRTPLFNDLNHYREIEPYVAFFHGIGIPTEMNDLNQRHYVAFIFDHKALWSRGYGDFLRGDRLMIVFTTPTASSSNVTSFKVTLLNDYYP